MRITLAEFIAARVENHGLFSAFIFLIFLNSSFVAFTAISIYDSPILTLFTMCTLVQRGYGLFLLSHPPFPLVPGILSELQGTLPPVW